jgi:hypothetical protein
MIARTARQLLPEHWATPSPLEGWSYKHLLGHCATGDWVCQRILRSAIAGDQINLSFLDQLNETNGRLAEERTATPVEDVIAELLAQGEETRGLLSQLTEEHEGLKPEGAPMSLGEFLRGFPGHDRGHLAQLKTALDSVML